MLNGARGSQKVTLEGLYKWQQDLKIASDNVGYRGEIGRSLPFVTPALPRAGNRAAENAAFRSPQCLRTVD